jgi:hypothetical protein
MSYIKMCRYCDDEGYCTGSCRRFSGPPYAPNYRPEVPIGAPSFPYPSIPPIPKGCICPPGSETTCQRKDCGRKDA